MSLKIALTFLIIGYAVCGPHTHKSKSGNKENIEDGPISPRDSDHYKNGNHNYEFDHESILGSHDVAEEFDHLTPAEAKKRLHTLAKKMDSNGDKFVDKKELTNWILQSFKSLTEEEALDELEDEDGDEDGKVTWEEHLAEAYGLFDDDLIIKKEDESFEDFQLLQNDKELFKTADVNGDSILDKSEYPAFSHPEEYGHMHETLYKQAMKKRDVDKDGFLSFEEFISDHHGSTPAANTEQYITEKDRFTHVFDLDGDKKLNKEEVLLWLIPDNVETAENEADHLIESSDENKDGKLSIEEIVDHHEIFVGSEATDFGEQLHNGNYHYEL